MTASKTPFPATERRLRRQNEPPQVETVVVKSLEHWLVEGAENRLRAAARACPSCEQALTIEQLCAAARSGRCPLCGHSDDPPQSGADQTRFELGPDGWPREAK